MFWQQVATNIFKIKERVVRGKTLFVVDLRAKGNGRKFFASEKEAADYLRQISDHGMAAAFSAEDRAELILIKSMLKDSGSSPLQAARFFLDHAKGSKTVKLSGAVGVFLEAKEAAKRRGSYVSKLKSLLKSLETFLPEAILVHEITRAQVEGWLKTKVADSTRKFALQDLRTFFKAALNNGWTRIDPCHGVQRVSFDGAAPVIFTVAESDLLMRRAERIVPELIPYLVLAMFCGMRPDAELKRARWSQIDLEAHLVEVLTTKLRGTRKRRFVTLQPNAAAWLRLAKEKLLKSEKAADLEDELIFFSKRLFRKLRFDFELMEREGAKPGKVKKRWVAAVPWSTDICRHSFCSYHVAHFKNEVVSAQEAGHSVNVLHSNYRQLVKPAEAVKFWAIMPS